MEALVTSGSSWGLPWPCVHEFLATITNRRRMDRPTPTSDAVDAVGALIAAPGARLLSEPRDHFSVLAGLLSQITLPGPRVHDARIAAICLGHGVTELWTADRDFSYFPALRTRNPLVG